MIHKNLEQEIEQKFSIRNKFPFIQDQFFPRDSNNGQPFTTFLIIINDCSNSQRWFWIPQKRNASWINKLNKFNDFSVRDFIFGANKQYLCCSVSKDNSFMRLKRPPLSISEYRSQYLLCRSVLLMLGNEFKYFVCSPHNKSSLMIIDLFVCLSVALTCNLSFMLCRYKDNIILKVLRSEAVEEFVVESYISFT